MSSINGSASLISQLISDYSGIYGKIFERANELGVNAKSYQNECEKDLNKISSQISSLHSLKTEIYQKNLKLLNLLEESREQLLKCESEIQYILKNKIKVNCYDNEGNKYYTEKIDTKALEIATRKKEETEQIFNKRKVKSEEAKALEEKVSKAIEEFSTIEKGMQLVKDSISESVYEINKNIQAISSEADYNIKCLSGVRYSMEQYASSKKIFIPKESMFKDFSAKNYSAFFDNNKKNI